MRLDKKLTEMVQSRSRAKDLIVSGHVRLNGEIITKPAYPYQGEKITIDMPLYVGRGAQKLLHALKMGTVSPKGCIALDIGASTGGFTEVLLEYGAERVYAVDVGRDQLDVKLKVDPRVVSMENTDARRLTREKVPGINFLTMDVSFISIQKVLPTLFDLLSPGSPFVILVKPQFELGKDRVPKSGVVKSERDRAEVVASSKLFCEDYGFQVEVVIESPIRGGEGNIEYLFIGHRKEQMYEKIHKATHDSRSYRGT